MGDLSFAQSRKQRTRRQRFAAGAITNGVMSVGGREKKHIVSAPTRCPIVFIDENNLQTCIGSNSGERLLKPSAARVSFSLGLEKQTI